MLKFAHDSDKLECGCDEAGAGALAGPVYAAAVIWGNYDDDFKEEYHDYLSSINDSKKISAKKREELKDFIEAFAVDYSVKSITNLEIDRINILNARILAMHKAVDELNVRPEHLLIDGDRFKDYVDPTNNEKIPHTLIKGGDAEYQAIACASILAKYYRDAYMQELHTEYPVYEWESNKGYGAKVHTDAIKEHGVSPYHRMTFGLCKKYKPCLVRDNSQ